MNGKEFLNAVDMLEKEKHIDREVIFEAMELALASAYKKHYGKPNSKVSINKDTGDIKIYSYKTVVEDVYAEDEEEDNLEGLTEEEITKKNKHKYDVDPEDIRISLEDARKIDKTLNLGDTIDEEVTPDDFGR